LSTKVHQIKTAYVGEIAVCNAVFHSTISSHFPEIFAIKLPSCPTFGPNSDVLGRQLFAEGPKFLTQFCKFESPSNMSQNLVTIDRATSEIRR